MVEILTLVIVDDCIDSDHKTCRIYSDNFFAALEYLEKSKRSALITIIPLDLYLV